MSLPTGEVTFLLGDVEGSTEMIELLGARYVDELASHRTIVRDAVAAAGGDLVDQRGEEFFAAFTAADNAVDAAISIQRAHSGRAMRVRLGLHTGEPSLTGEGYVGLDVHRAARICGAAHGGQVLLSDATRQAAGDPLVTDLGEYLLKGVSTPERLFQLIVSDLPSRFAQLRVPPAEPHRRRLGRARPAARAPSLEELAWETRARLPVTSDGDRPELSRLAAALSTAARVSTSARRFCAGVDRKALEQRRDRYLPMGRRSARVAGAAETSTQQLILLDAVETANAALEHAARRVPARAEEIERVTATLDTALDSARNTIGQHAERLRRTLSPGVYRSASHEYVVIDHDTLGIEHRHHFESRSEARSYRRAIVIREKRQQLDYAGPPSPKQFEAGAGGGGL
jgi:class 3 adenylate cyclase